MTSCYCSGSFQLLLVCVSSDTQSLVITQDLYFSTYYYYYYYYYTYSSFLPHFLRFFSTLLLPQYESCNAQIFTDCALGPGIVCVRADLVIRVWIWIIPGKNWKNPGFFLNATPQWLLDRSC
jgi:hypothetical protein